LDAVIKVGGSLAETPGVLKELCVEVSQIAKKYSILVIPGGGKFADAVRELDSKFALPAAISHKMAILAMDQYGLLLSHLIPDGCTCESLQDAKRLIKSGGVTVFLPSKSLSREDPFEPSWDVTSDSIAAYFAIKLKAKKLILATDVDGIFVENPKKNPHSKLLKEVSAEELLKINGRTSIDRFLPRFLLKNQLECYVVNGNYPKRIGDILAGSQTIGTRILLSSRKN
jgi:aspartokinase-like uncharacterized kinase